MQNNFKLEGEILRDFLLQYKYNDAMRRLASGVAHNYNNVFAALSGQLSIFFKEEGDGGNSSERIDIMQTLLQRGIAQTEVLYEFSSRKHFKKKFNSPGRLAEQAISILNTMSRQHTFELQRDRSLPRLYSQSRDIMLMLIYLGENAMESMTDGGDILLSLSCWEDSSETPYLTFTMTDSGSGFSEMILSSAFEPFVTTKISHNPAGLGLYAARVIADDHNGNITIGHNGNGQTEVMVRLPIEERGCPEQIRETAVPVYTAEKERRNQVFLIVEDEVGMRNMLNEGLQRRGHTAFCVQSCEEAIKQYTLHSHTITVILLDMRLSDGYGFDCARRLLAVSAKPKLIFMSGVAVESEDDKFSTYPFLKKPFSIKVLEAMVNNE